MIKKLAIATMLLSISVSSANVLAHTAQSALLTASPAGVIPVQDPATSPDGSATISEDDLGLKMDLLWCAEPGTYDPEDEEDLVSHVPEVLEPGKTYEIAIMVSNPTDDNIATPWGIDYLFTVPRVVAAEEGADDTIYGRACSCEGNVDADKAAEEMFTGISATEPLAVWYVDASNRIIHSDRDGKASFYWGEDSRILDEESLIFYSRWQGLSSRDYVIMTFQIETRPLMQWQEFISVVHADPVIVNITEATEGAHFWRIYSGDMRHEYEVTIDCEITIPEWLRNLKEDGDWWDVMIRPRFEEDGTANVDVCIRKYNGVYVVATDQFGMGYEVDKWVQNGRLSSAIFDGYEYSISAENYALDSGKIERWAIIRDDRWAELMDQESLNVTLRTVLR